jgi:FPC/CPF motif-containing protein YcgG
VILLQVADVERALADLPAWAAAAYVEVRDKVLDEAFPCTFGTVAQRRGEILYAFISPDNIRDALVAYTDFLRPLEPVVASLTPLAVVMPPLTGFTEREYFDYGWSLLQRLHEADIHPWPDRIPRDPDDPKWSYCFGGIPLFVNFKTPAHYNRRSRRTAQSFMLLFQSRDGFDVVAGDSPQGRRARDLIRRKLAAYDAVSVYPELAHYATSANREWRQYFVPEANAPLARECPFHVISQPTAPSSKE